MTKRIYNFITQYICENNHCLLETELLKEVRNAAVACQTKYTEAHI